MKMKSRVIAKPENKVIVTLFSDDLTLMSVVSEEDGKLYVDFYKDEVLLDSREIIGHSVQYAHDVAENFVVGVIRLDDTGRVHGV
jgi:hypothetical protein